MSTELNKEIPTGTAAEQDAAIESHYTAIFERVAEKVVARVATPMVEKMVDHQAQRRVMEMVKEESQKAAARGQRPRDLANAPEFMARVEALEDAHPSGVGSIKVERQSFHGLGRMVVESSEWERYKARGFRGDSEEFQFKGPAGLAQGRTAGVTGTSDIQATMSTDYQQRIIPLPFRRLHLRELMNVITTALSAVKFLRETSFTNNAAASSRNVSDGALAVAAPKSTWVAAAQTYNVATIDHQIEIDRDTMEDAPQVANRIEMQMIEGLLLKEDTYIYGGSGVAPVMKGITVESGCQAYSWSAGSVGDNKADAVLRAIVIAELANYLVDLTALHNSDWADIAILKDQMDNYLIPSVHRSDLLPSLWGRPVVQGPAFTQGVGVTGAFSTAAELYDRMQASVQFLTQTNDDAVKGVIRAYGRMRSVAAWLRPENFTKITFDNTPPDA